jgi:hypothetical protein
MEHECARPCSEKHTTGPYPEPDDTSLHRHTEFLKDLSYILTRMYAQSPQVPHLKLSWPKFCTHSSSK